MNDKMTDDAHERILRLKEGDRMGLIDADKIPWRGDYVSKGDVDVMPTIDPVKHAHWIAVNPDRDGKNASIFECSNCDAAIPFHAFIKDSDCRKSCHYYYCPQCGAKMDEVTE